MEWLKQLLIDQPHVRILDIAIVWYVIYRLLMFARGTRAMNLMKGVGVIVVARVVSSMVGLQTVNWLLDQIISWGVIAMVVLFQPELRKALEVIGRGLTRKSKSQNPSEKLIDDLEVSVLYMSKRKIGALISIEAQDSLKDYIQTGIPIDSEISHQLMTNIFVPNTPLHDGAVIVSDYRVAAGACYLPLSASDAIPKELGTRHRAAIGLGEVSDALTIIVSEETGGISLVKNDHLHRAVKPKEFRKLLTEYLSMAEEQRKDSISWVRDFIATNFKQKGGDTR